MKEPIYAGQRLFQAPTSPKATRKEEMSSGLPLSGNRSSQQEELDPQNQKLEPPPPKAIDHPSPNLCRPPPVAPPLSLKSLAKRMRRLSVFPGQQSRKRAHSCSLILLHQSLPADSTGGGSEWEAFQRRYDGLGLNGGSGPFACRPRDTRRQQEREGKRQEERTMTKTTQGERLDQKKENKEKERWGKKKKKEEKEETMGIKEDKKREKEKEKEKKKKEERKKEKEEEKEETKNIKEEKKREKEKEKEKKKEERKKKEKRRKKKDITRKIRESSRPVELTESLELPKQLDASPISGSAVRFFSDKPGSSVYARELSASGPSHIRVGRWERRTFHAGEACHFLPLNRC